MSKDTANFLLKLLNQLTVPASDPEFESIAKDVVKSRSELEAIANGK